MADTAPTPAPAPAPDPLGDLVSRHPVDNRTRWVNAAWALPIGVLTGWLGLWALLRDGGASGSGKGLGTALGLGLCGLVIGITQATRALRGGKGEYFEVRSHGLVHGNSSGRKASWTWNQIAVITIPRPHTSVGAHAHRFGNDYRCVLRLADGGRVRIDGLAVAARALGAAVADRCPDARRSEGDEWTRRAGAWLLLAAAGCAVVVVLLIRYLSDHPGGDRITVDSAGHTSYEYVQGIDGTTVALIAIALAVCALGAITLVGLFFYGRLHHRR
ncbi:hypothetical protein [Streptomyces sp. CBMA123]|uniref:hypothetical protein n=1 Tax=Streptomyces sp. CBMA123 TaxID=1896313 RepID=UPI001661E926|nr:hypothetical protein [Streptomyces sp. CBMA123]MBD0696029.1 hypothetical protein [Streptomyces sp. CBMA123]